MKAARLISLLLIALVMGINAEEKPKKKDLSKAKASAAKAEPVKDDTGLESIGALIPEGLKNVKVKIPGFTEGRPSSLITAETMTRVNANELFCEGVIIHLYGKTPKDNMRVDLKTATYHLDTKMLVSNDRSKVARTDFTVEGDSVVYDTTTSSGVMKGHVHMVIHNASRMAPKPEAKPESEDAKSATAASSPTSKP